jgi:hypothetical protein
LILAIDLTAYLGELRLMAAEHSEFAGTLLL